MIHFDEHIFQMGWFNQQLGKKKKTFRRFGAYEGVLSSPEQWKKALVCLGYIGDQLPSYIGIIINHDIRIPIKQPGFNGK